MSYDKNYVELNNGRKMPIIGLGTWQSTPEEACLAIKTALEAGYRHIDAAYLYKNEDVIGKALKEVFAEGKIKREDVFITTKLPLHGLRPQHVKHFLELSLSALQLGYVDLYLIHTPLGFQYVSDSDTFPKDANGELMFDYNTDLVALWKKMEEMVDLGLAKSIGVSNFSIDQLQRILKSCRIKPVTDQVECHVYNQRQPLCEFCKQHKIVVTGYAPIGSPGLRVALKNDLGVDVECPILLEDPQVKLLSQKYKKSPSQILLRFLVQRGIVVIPKSTNPKRIKENFDIFDFKLSADDFKTLQAMDKNMRLFQLFSQDGAKKHPEYESWKGP